MWKFRVRARTLKGFTDWSLVSSGIRTKAVCGDGKRHPSEECDTGGTATSEGSGTTTTSGSDSSAGGTGGTSSTTSCEASSGTTRNSVHPEEYVEEHNAYRCELGLEPLAWDCEIAAVAQKWADERAADGCGMSHSTNDWRNQAFTDAGYPDHAG